MDEQESRPFEEAREPFDAAVQGASLPDRLRMFANGQTTENPCLEAAKEIEMLRDEQGVLAIILGEIAREERLGPGMTEAVYGHAAQEHARMAIRLLRMGPHNVGYVSPSLPR